MKNVSSIAVIVPAKNSGACLPAFLDSLKAQTFKDFTVYFSVGTSTDNTVGLIEEAKRENELNILATEPNDMMLGECKNYWFDNRLIKEKYVALIDADDIPHPDLFEKLYKAAEETGADLIQCGFTRLDAETKKKISDDQIHNKEDIEDILENKDLVYIHTATWNKLFRTSLIGEDVRFAPEKRFEDVNFVIKYLSKCKRIHSINEPLYDYMVGKNTNSTIMSEEELKSVEESAQRSMIGIKQYMVKTNPKLYERGFLDALAFVRYGVGFTSRMCMAFPSQKAEISKRSREFLDREFPKWVDSEYLQESESSNLKKKTVFIHWCVRLYKKDKFPTFVRAYSTFTKILHKDIKP